MTRHPCSWPGCMEMIDTSLFLCPMHWQMLPYPARTDLTVAYKKRKDTAALFVQASNAHELIKANVVAMLEKKHADLEREHAGEENHDPDESEWDTQGTPGSGF